jgi:2-aminoadipate transaminase
MTAHDLPQGTTPGIIPLLLGHPDPETLLTPELREAMQRVISSPQAYVSLQYGPEQGARELVEILVEKLKREQDLAIQPANLMIVAGSTHAVDMLARLYAGKGSVVLVEAPTYADSLHIFRDHQLELCAIPMDEEGLLPGELERQLERLRARGVSPGLLYTVPNFHNPTGRTLSETRRREIIRLARQENFLIVEDDVYHDLGFEGTVPASFYALAGGQQVMSIGSFSKTLAPGLRLGWLLGSEENIQRCLTCGTMQMGGGANPFTARVVAEYCLSGAWEKHIAHVRTLYKTRRDRALSALEQFMPSGVEWTHPAGGFFLWLRLPERVFAQDVKRLALARGVAVAAGDGFFVNPADGAHHLRLAYSRATPEEITNGIRILAEVIKTLNVLPQLP